VNKPFIKGDCILIKNLYPLKNSCWTEVAERISSKSWNDEVFGGCWKKTLL